MKWYPGSSPNLESFHYLMYCGTGFFEPELWVSHSSGSKIERCKQRDWGRICSAPVFNSVNLRINGKVTVAQLVGFEVMSSSRNRNMWPIRQITQFRMKSCREIGSKNTVDSFGKWQVSWASQSKGCGHKSTTRCLEFSCPQVKRPRLSIFIVVPKQGVLSS